ncbi:phage minor head protein [Bosea sp. UC22_33]|uniref:phage head morphogenesis protein n=1 Tax=Bosea sp. UC22_33 TaxID=3350165 RepID=UPI00366C5E2B
MNVQAWMREARTTKRKRAVLRPISATVAFQAALLAPTNRLLKRMAEQVAQDVLPAAISAKAQMMRDDLNWFERAMRALRDFADGFVEGLRSEWRDAFDTEEERNKRRFNEAVRSAIGIDLGAVIQAEGIGNTIDAAVLANVSRVRGLSQDVANRLASKLLDALTRGLSNRDIERILIDEFGMARRRAKFIARDQAASFNGDLNEIRQTAMGVVEYEWSTSLDERVTGNPDGIYPNARPSHWDRQGKRFRWNKPPEGGHPGQRPGCRCTARAVIEF